jgi:hypothetical protein
MDTTFEIKVKQLTNFNEIVEPIYQNFDKKYQDILFNLVNNWLKNNDFNKKLLADYVEELISEYTEYQSGANRWNNVKTKSSNGFDNC